MKSMLTDSQILFLRLRHQRLLALPGDRPASVEQALADLCGVQAQDLPAGELSAGVRTPGLSVAQVEAARLRPQSILRIWCMRSTLHLVTARDACWLNPLLGPRAIAADRRRMAQLGWDDELAARATRLALERVAAQGGITRPELIRLLKENALPHAGQAPIHLLARLVNSGYLCQGPDKGPGTGSGKQPTFVPFETWAGPLQSLNEEDGLRELARRYLAAYAPASPQDLATWSGLKVSEARRAWDLLAGELAPVETAQEQLFMLKTQEPDVAHAFSLRGEVLRLLPRFDTYLLGYHNRQRILAPELEYKIRYGGILVATLLWDGRIAGAWSSKMRGKTLELDVQPFEPLPERLLPALEQEAQRVGVFLLAEKTRLLVDGVAQPP